MMNEGANTAPTQNVGTEVVSQEQPSNVSVSASKVENTDIKSAETTSTEEKILKQSEVDKIVAHEKQRAAEKAKREALQEIEQKNFQAAQYQQQQIQSGAVDGNAPLTRNDLLKMQQEQQALAQKHAVEEINSVFVQKIDSIKNADPTFEKEVLANLPGSFDMRVRHALNGLDNASDVMREFANHPSKYNDVVAGLNSENPAWGFNVLYKLSNSIKVNKEALSKPVAKAPLDQIIPSPTGKDSGKMTKEQMRKDPKYRW
jgi:hypothetical protein